MSDRRGSSGAENEKSGTVGWLHDGPVDVNNHLWFRAVHCYGHESLASVTYATDGRTAGHVAWSATYCSLIESTAAAAAEHTAFLAATYSVSRHQATC